MSARTTSLAAEQGWGWTRCARGAAAASLLLATLASGVAMSAPATASVTEHVIVRGSAGCATSVASSISRLGGRVTHPLAILNGASATIGSGALAALRADACVSSVTADGSVSLSSIGSYDPTANVGSLFNTTQMIGAQSYWQAGYTGKGVDIALVDSGVSPVQGLASANQVVNGPDISFDSQSPNLVGLDAYGHGTHMASIIAGRDPATIYAGNTTQFLGVAPDARIVNVKVADANGASDVSQIIAGIDWTVQHAHDGGLNVRVINLSFGTDGVQSYLVDPLAYAAEQAWLNGIVVVAAAGNGGSTTAGLANPAEDPYVIAVGAADTKATMSTAAHTVASFSNSGSLTRSPDLVAPGVHIEGLRDPGSTIDQHAGATASVADRFFLGSGTSQATAIVSGAAALILQQRPDASPDDVKALLTSTATPLNGAPAVRQGNGELNLAQALTVNKIKGKQKFQQSDGSGLLEGARGSLHLVSNGVTLSGEQDIFGTAWNPVPSGKHDKKHKGDAVNTGAWSGIGWTGGGWSGGGWSGGGWSGGGWSGGGWSGGGWSGGGWSSSVWTGGGWSGGGWSGSGWSGGGWSGGGWSDATWA